MTSFAFRFENSSRCADSCMRMANRAWIGPMTRNAAIHTNTLSSRAVTTKIPMVTA